MSVACLVIAVVLFVLAALGEQPIAEVDAGWLGLAFLAGAHLPIKRLRRP